MGFYNSHAPQIMGQEWVPIREQPITLSEEESGYTFPLAVTSTIVSGSFWVAESPPSYSTQISMMSVYRAGTEDKSGAVRKVVIPTTYATFNLTNPAEDSASAFGDTNVEAIADPGDTSAIFVEGNVFGFFEFGVQSYASTLRGKRILNVDILYSLTANVPNPPESGGVANIFFGFYNTATSDFMGTPITSGTQNPTTQIERLRFGNVNLWAASPSKSLVGTRFPWRYEELAKFDPLTFEYFVTIESNATYAPSAGTRTSYELLYMAMEVTYCDETRVAYGGRGGMITSGLVRESVQEGMNVVQLRSTNMHISGAVLTPGDYTVAVSLGKAPDMIETSLYSIADGDAPKVNAIRQLYPLPAHPALTITPTEVELEQFTQEETNIIPPLGLYTRTAQVTGTHIYHEIFSAPAYPAFNSTQEIDQRNGPVASTAYPQVRFYARQYNDTTEPLVLTRVGGSETVSLTADAFSELPEIIDGWREVTLRFTGTVPTYQRASSEVGWQFTVAGAVASSAWEVLGATSLTPTGVFDGDPSTYLAPRGADSFITVNSTSFTLADITLLFSQDPPAVTGLAIVSAEQTLTPIGSECAATPECVPSRLYYHRLTWQPLSAASIPATGFGYYELQRKDEVDETWYTVLQASSPTVTGFSDYEARVDRRSYYRIRTANALEFFGSWSAEVTNALPAPGVLTSGDGNSTLMFTTNQHQDGSGNLAYTQTWDSSITEEFTFPEAEGVQLREMYQRDFAVAFTPSERGGERFSRNILVHNSAVPSGLIRDGFTSLRDLAWDDLAYVCVRNELGDRWFATVRVPSGEVKRNRQLFIAKVDIIEVTDTPGVLELPEEM